MSSIGVACCPQQGRRKGTSRISPFCPRVTSTGSTSFFQLRICSNESQNGLSVLWLPCYWIKMMLACLRLCVKIKRAYNFNLHVWYSRTFM